MRKRFAASRITSLTATAIRSTILFRCALILPATRGRCSANWRMAQQAEYAAFINTGRFVISSASPELFFQLDGEQLTAKPMKGTAPRGRTLAEDEAHSPACGSRKKTGPKI
jgi:hypothetical protein